MAAEHEHEREQLREANEQLVLTGQRSGSPGGL